MIPIIPYPTNLHLQEKIILSINEYQKSNQMILCKITHEDSLLLFFYTQSKHFMLYVEPSHIHCIESLFSSLSNHELYNIQHIYIVKGVDIKLKHKFYYMFKKYNLNEKIVYVGDYLLHQQIGISKDGIFFHSFSKL